MERTPNKERSPGYSPAPSPATRGSMRITTWNLNGIRAALRKGFAEELESINPDVLLLQEIRALPEQMGAWAAPEGWHVHWHPAEKKGYSGVGVLSRTPIEDVQTGLSADDPDSEGRVLSVRTGGVRAVSIYLPSGSSGPHRQEQKEQWLKRFSPWAAALVDGEEPVVLGGDLNIAHTANDIHNPTGNKKNSGFLPHERQWFTDLLDQGWTDALRSHFGDQKGPYTWWSTRGRARELDRGWRIDYLLANKALGPRCGEVRIRRDAGITISDHAPVTLELS
ncbi:MAG: exodeoxyribonuclease III [Proteobacteria bacterium]|nr:exodeoxyribonuclease III [Pseudomonadota bacterium]